MDKKDIKGYITAKDRTRIVKDFNFEDVVSNGCEEFDLPKMSIIEYKNGEKIYEDYSELDLYLEDHFIPSFIKKINKKNDFTNEYESYLTIPLNRIVDLKLNHDEFEHVCNYLKNEGIIIRGRVSILDDNISNYECISSFKYRINNSKYKKNIEEEIEMFNNLRKTNYKFFRNKIILNNIRIAKFIANQYSFMYNVDSDELESYAYEALCKSVDNFDYTKGVPFSSYAYLMIKRSVLKGVASVKNKYRDEHYNDYYFKVNKYIDRVEKEKDKKLTDDYNLINNVLDLMIKDGVITFRQRNTFKKYIFSNLDLSLDSDNFNILIDDNYEVIEHSFNINKLKECFDEIFANGFSKKELFVIKKRFGFDGIEPMGLEQVGKELGLSKERVRQIEKKVLLRLKNSYSRKLSEFIICSNDGINTIDLYDYIEEDDYCLDDIYNENYDYKKSLKR